MAFTLYTYTDSGAPTLNGFSGSLINVLNAVLLNGYGAKPAAGWLTSSLATAPYQAVYQQGSGSSGHYMFVVDNTTYSNEAYITGIRSLTTINTGSATGSWQFPTYSQLGIGSGAVVCRKSNGANVTAKPWYIYADSRTMYMFVPTGDNGSSYYAWMFGDFYSYKSGSADNYRCMIVGRNGINTGTNTNDSLDRINNTLSSQTQAHWASANLGGSQTSQAINVHGDGVKGNNSYLYGSVPFLNGSDSGMYLSPLFVVDDNSTIRGVMRGFYQILHSNPFPDTFFVSGSGAYAGRNFQVVQPTANGGTYFIEISDTLLTN